MAPVDRSHQLLLTFHINYGPSLCRLQDKVRQSKIAFFHTPPLKTSFKFCRNISFGNGIVGFNVPLDTL